MEKRLWTDKAVKIAIKEAKQEKAKEIFYEIENYREGIQGILTDNISWYLYLKVKKRHLEGEGK